jgi:hypothetical protein
MGEFYAAQISTLITRPRIYELTWGDEYNTEALVRAEQERQQYREQLRTVRANVHSLAVELLRYQPWRRERSAT